MFKTKLTLGTKIEIDVYDSNGTKVDPTLISQFEAMLPDGTLEVLSPIREGRVYPIYKGTMLSIIFEKNGELLSFDALALDRKIVGNIHVLRVQPTSDEELIQRRNFFRFQCILDIKYRFFGDLDIKSDDRGAFEKGITRDISGGGLCLSTNIKPEIAWFMEGIFNAGGEVRFIGKVLRIINIHEKAKYNFELGVEFLEIANRDRERIISFIFDEQRKLLKKGWTKK